MGGSPVVSASPPAARAYDALIAATALARRLPLYTSKPEDFDGIPALTVQTVRAASAPD